MSHSLPFPRILLGPGPSSVSSGVLEALGRAPIGYLDPELFTLLDDLRNKLRQLYGTSNEFTVPLTGTGMAGMECCLANLLEPGDSVVIGVHGFFGARMVEICTRLGADVTRVDAEWGDILDPQQIEAAVKAKGNVKLVGCVHAETSTGVRQPLEAIAQIARNYDALFFVDAVTSLGGISVDIDRVGCDVSYSGTQKCVGAPPGLAPITVSERAWQVVVNRGTPVSSWYYDWKLLRAYYDAPHAYHHTVPVNLIYALHTALNEIQEEGIAERFERHQRVSDLLMAGLAELNIDAFAREGYRLPTLNAVTIPSGVTDEIAVRKQLLVDYGIEIGGGLGALKGRIWRIGTMGASANERNVLLLLAALRTILPKYINS